MSRSDGLCPRMIEEFDAQGQPMGKWRECNNPDAASRYSFGAYAGFLCEKCAIDGYRDHCGLEPSEVTAADLDEPIDSEPDCFGSERDW